MTHSPAQSVSREANSPTNVQADIAASCRWPVLFLFGSAIVWLVIGTALAFIASLKFHAPGFLADSPIWTYGRVYAARTDALLYGFAIQAALGVSLWLLCRLGRTTLTDPRVCLTAAAIWNFGVMVGIGGILGGDSTGYEAFEMPRYAAPVLFVAYLVIAVCAIITFHKREERALYPSQWFILGGVFWFAWIFSTASALLLCSPVRGVLQSTISWWFAHNLETIVLGFAGLASISYFISKLLERPLHSSYLAMLGFWGLTLFGSWGGIPQGAPLPAWIISLSVVGTVMSAVPILAIMTNFCQTARKDLNALDNNAILRFSYVALIFWFIASVQKIIGALPKVSTLTDYTYFGVAQKELALFGFFAMAMFGAIYYIAPQLVGHEFPCDKSPKIHFWFTFIGVTISYLALVISGIGQGIILSDPKNPFVAALKASMLGVRVRTLGDLLILLGQLALLLNFLGLVAQGCCKAFCGKQKEVRK